MLDALAPCPFCGNPLPVRREGYHVQSDEAEHSSPVWWIECKECGCEGPLAFASEGMDGEVAARLLWNVGVARAVPAALIDDLAACRTFVELCDGDEGYDLGAAVKPSTLDELIHRAREVTEAVRGAGTPLAERMAPTRWQELNDRWHRGGKVAAWEVGELLNALLALDVSLALTQEQPRAR
jgi:hypothetical protein